MQKGLFDTYPIFLEKESFNESIYTFTTGSGIRYTLYCSRASYLFDEPFCHFYDVFELGFAPNVPENGKIKTYEIDPLIRKTIVNFVVGFIKQNNCALAYVCASEDLRGECRSKLFKKWFKDSPEKEEFRYESKTFKYSDSSPTIEMIGAKDDINFDNYLLNVEVLG